MEINAWKIIRTNSGAVWTIINLFLNGSDNVFICSVNCEVGFGHLKNLFGQLIENFGQLCTIFGQLLKNFGQNQQNFGHLPQNP
ncbi:hypothetical protein LG307_19740 [Sutcliffiella horikoshii]|uniref:hypothetical protein n=1 Tax=Sutcliffiella horikoshii TaxID=79883 RepID=UPI00385086BA